MLGYIIGAAAAFGFYFHAADAMLEHFWFNVSPIKLSFEPFDYSAVHVDTSGALFKPTMNHWQLGPIGDYQFVASPI